MKILISISLFLLSINCFSETNIGNAMSVSEANMVHAYLNLERDLKNYKLMNSYFLSQEELKTLDIYIEEAKLEKGTKLIFLEEKEFPWSDLEFYTDVVRNSNVYINKDKLYNVNELGKKKAITLSEAAIISIKINHRNNPIETVVSKEIDKKIKENIKSSINQVTLKSQDREEIRLFTKTVKSDENTQVKTFISDQNGIYEITSLISEKNYCERGITSTSFTLKNLHIKYHTPEDFLNSSQIITFLGEVTYRCYENLFYEEFRAKMILFVKYNLRAYAGASIDRKWWFNKDVHAFADLERIKILINSIYKTGAGQ